MMKKLFPILPLACICCTASATPRLCVSLQVDSWQKSTFTPTRTWELIDSGDDGTIRGIEACSSTSNTSSTVKSSLALSSGANRYCWCRMIFPALSTNWVTSEKSYSDEDGCLRNCNMACRNAIADDTSLQNYLINNIIYQL